MRPSYTELEYLTKMYPATFFLVSIGSAIFIGVVSYFWVNLLWAELVIVPLVVVGLLDFMQRDDPLLRNYPAVGHLRYMMSSLGPIVRQHVLDSDTSKAPFSQEVCRLVYSRARGEGSMISFGTGEDVYNIGHAHLNHSVAALDPSPADRVLVGGDSCKQPYSASRFNLSAMGFGPLSKNAILALNLGAKLGAFAQNTGEDGISPYHLEHGGDLIWQIGTGYFGCRDPRGRFDPVLFGKNSRLDTIKMIEIKLSQGGRPGHGALLPGSKVTREIARIYSVPVGTDVVSPRCHSEFATPRELLHFVGKLRELSGGKPVGVKLCVGKPSEFLGICKAMLETGILLDYIHVDGSEGGSGAAPWELMNHVGKPLLEGLSFVHNALVGTDLRDKIRVIASGKIATGFDIFRAIALGADICCSARGMLLALGCIQAQKCHTGKCPVGIATQNPFRYRAIDPTRGALHVANYHRSTIEAFQELLGVAGLSSPAELTPRYVCSRRGSGTIENYGEIFSFVDRGSLLESKLPHSFREDWISANADRF